jgi:hypothetical protein
VTGLVYLRANRIVHCDIKSPNRLVDRQFLLKVGIMSLCHYVTMPSALVRKTWDEKWQLSRRGPLYLKMWLRNLKIEQFKFGT